MEAMNDVRRELTIIGYVFVLGALVPQFWMWIHTEGPRDLYVSLGANVPYITAERYDVLAVSLGYVVVAMIGFGLALGILARSFTLPIVTAFTCFTIGHANPAGQSIGYLTRLEHQQFRLAMFACLGGLLVAMAWFFIVRYNNERFRRDLRQRMLA